MKGKSAFVVGCNLEGLVTAEVFDSDSKPRDAGIAEPPVVLYARAIEALKKVGIELPTELLAPVTAIVVHHAGQVDREANRYAPGVAFVAEYQMLVQFLRERCETKRVKFFDDCRVQGVKGGKVVCAVEDRVFQRPVLQLYDVPDLLVGADGVGSKVRQAMQEADASLRAKIRAGSDMTYCINNISAADVRPHGAREEEGVAHRYEAAPRKAAGDGRGHILLYPMPDGTFSGYLQAQDELFRELRASPRAAIVALTEAFGTVVPKRMLGSLMYNLVQPVPVPEGTSLWCSKLVGRGMVLLGDAAHSMLPALSAGSTTSLESASVLGACLAKHATVQNALEAFNTQRLADVRSMTTISAKAATWKEGSLLPRIGYLSHVAISRSLSLLPFVRVQPVLERVPQPGVPQSKLLRALRRDAALCVVGAVCGVVKLIPRRARQAAGRFVLGAGPKTPSVAPRFQQHYLPLHLSVLCDRWS